MGIYKDISMQEKEFVDKETKKIIKKYRGVTYKGRAIHEILGYKNFGGFVGESVVRTTLLNKTLIKQLEFVLNLVKSKEEVKPIYSSCFRYERALIAQDYFKKRAAEIKQFPVNHEYLEALKIAMEEYEPKLKIYKSENGISIAYKGYVESTQYLLKEDEDLFEMIKYAYLITVENDITKILGFTEELKKHSAKVYDCYLSSSSL